MERLASEFKCKVRRTAFRLRYVKIYCNGNFNFTFLTFTFLKSYFLHVQQIMENYEKLRGKKNQEQACNTLREIKVWIAGSGINSCSLKLRPQSRFTTTENLLQEMVKFPYCTNFILFIFFIHIF